MLKRECPEDDLHHAARIQAESHSQGLSLRHSGPIRSEPASDYFGHGREDENQRNELHIEMLEEIYFESDRREIERGKEVQDKQLDSLAAGSIEMFGIADCDPDEECPEDCVDPYGFGDCRTDECGDQHQP